MKGQEIRYRLLVIVPKSVNATRKLLLETCICHFN